MVVCGTDLQKRFEETFANDRWEGLEWYAEYLVFVVIQLQFATFLKQLNYSSRSFAVESRHNLLLLDLNTTQLNFCSWVKTQPPRNRVACSKIKVFTRSSPQTCSLLVDKFFLTQRWSRPRKEILLRRCIKLSLVSHSLLPTCAERIHGASNIESLGFKGQKV